MNDHAAVAQRVAAEVRAEMARQNKRQSDLAAALGITAGTAGRKHAGRVEFTLTELVQVADWLDVPLSRLYVTEDQAASA